MNFDNDKLCEALQSDEYDIELAVNNYKQVLENRGKKLTKNLKKKTKNVEYKKSKERKKSLLSANKDDYDIIEDQDLSDDV